MLLNTILEESILVQNWKSLLMMLLVFVVINAFSKRKAAKSVAAYTEHNEKDHLSENCKTYLPSEREYQPALEIKRHVRYAGAIKTLSGGSQQFYEMVNNRRSVRSFSRQPIPFAIVEACIHAAGTAPSGAHTEPWTFCVISDADMKLKIRNIIEAEEFLNYTQRMQRQWVADLRPLQTDHVKKYLTDAPYLIMVFKQIYGVRRTDGHQQRKQHYYNEISVAIATGILLCALQAAGLNSLVTTPLNCGPALRSLLARPVNEKMLFLIPVGYAAKDCRVPDLQRKPIEQILVKY